MALGAVHINTTTNQNRPVGTRRTHLRTETYRRMPALGGTNSFFQGQPLQVQSTPSAEDRFLPLPARSQGQSLGPAQGRFGPFAKPSPDGRYLREADGSSST